MRIIVDMPGGFGNQMFGYAFGYALSKELGCEYWIHTPFQDSGITWELDVDKLNIEYDKRVTYLWSKKIFDRAIGNKIRRRLAVGTSAIIREKMDASLEHYVDNIKRNSLIYGNWENAKFFDKYREDIIKMFVPRVEFEPEAKNYLTEILNQPCVGMHVRRGDKVALGGCLNAEYYRNAIKEICKRLAKPIKIYVVSDDVEWCREQFANETDVEIVYPEVKTRYKTLFDWMVIKNCTHHIIGDSTFSWWAAWLSEEASQTVICPKQMKYRLEKWNAI